MLQVFSSSKPVSRYDLTFLFRSIFLAIIEGIEVDCDPIVHQIKAISDAKKIRSTVPEGEDRDMLKVDDYLGGMYSYY